MQGSGDCLFNCFAENFGGRAGAGQGVTGDDLRRMMVWGFVVHKEICFAKYATHIMANYNGERGSAGPFSYYTWCDFMLQPGNWGDDACAGVLGQLLGLTVTMLNFQSSPPVIYPFYHDRDIADTQILLLYNGVSHFSTASKC